MKARLITAGVGIIAILILVYLGSWPFALAVCAVSLIALDEYKRMLDKKGIHVYAAPMAVILVILTLAACAGSLKLFTGTFLLCFFLMLFSILKIRKEAMDNLIYSAFGLTYFGLGFSSMLFLREGADLLIPPMTVMNNGIFLILFCLIGTWSSDSFAFLVGRKWGHHKMAPHISPNKTVEGLVGGAIGCVVLCLVFAAIIGFNLGSAFITSIIIAIVAPIGDLFESYLKRACDVKDSGNILPGHGGMMDRFDSLLFVAPTVAGILCIAV